MQFETTAQKERVASYELKHGLDPANRHGLTVTNSGIFHFMLPFMILNSATMLMAPPQFSLPFVLISLLSLCLSKYVHPYLHVSYEQVQREAPLLLRILFRSPLGSAMWIHHFVHHRNPQFSFNLMLPFGDYLRGVYRGPSEEERAETRKWGWG